MSLDVREQEAAGTVGENLQPVQESSAPVAAVASADVATVHWIQSEVAAHRPLPLLEVELVVNSLHADQQLLGKQLPLLIEVPNRAEFMPIHAVNVTATSMVLAESLEFEPFAVRRVGTAALLYDIGMLRVPVEIIQKQGQLTQEEREQIKQHPVHGARILLAQDASLDLAAVVAYEHHLRMDGSGYPQIRYPRSAHYVSRLVQLCDVFCGLRTSRPYRAAWPPEIILSFLMERAGFEFHPTLTTALMSLLQGSAPRQTA
jgi:HD-GYP domain-containing protein (c-di-GMP phosphodiesterase class II)